MRSRTSRSSPQGFTLLELLVVIAILAVLICTMLPTLTRGRDQARAVSCLSNQRTIAMGLLQYTTEWGVYPYNYRTWDPGKNDYYIARRFALECLSSYVGGPVGKTDPATGVVKASDLTGLQVGQFPNAYICPSVDQAKVFGANPGTLYHASYWSNVAVRVNKGDRPYSPDGLYSAWDPKDLTSSGACLARWYQYCPNDPRPYRDAHWRPFYYPRPDTVKNPAGTMFAGDTNNNDYRCPGDPSFSNGPGMWELMPGWGYMFGGMGFDRHNGDIMASYVDGHARPFSIQEANDEMRYPRYPDGDSACAFMVQTVGDDGCGGRQTHTTPEAVCH